MCELGWYLPTEVSQLFTYNVCRFLILVLVGLSFISHSGKPQSELRCPSKTRNLQTWHPNSWLTWLTSVPRSQPITLLRHFEFICLLNKFNCYINKLFSEYRVAGYSAVKPKQFLKCLFIKELEPTLNNPCDSIRAKLYVKSNSCYDYLIFSIVYFVSHFGVRYIFIYNEFMLI